MPHSLDTGQSERSGAAGRVVVVVLVAVLGTVFMGLHGLEERTRAENAVPFLTAALVDSYEDALTQAVGAGEGGGAVPGDLVVITAADRVAAQAEGPAVVADRLAATRAAALHRDGFPEPVDPLTFTGFPRPILEQYSDARHDDIGVARFVVGVAAGVALVAVLVVGSGSLGSFFSLPGYALGSVWVASRLARFLMVTMLERTHPNWRRHQAEVVAIMDRATLPVQFGAITLIVAGAVLGFLLPRLVSAVGSGVGGAAGPEGTSDADRGPETAAPPVPDPPPQSDPHPVPVPETAPDPVARERAATKAPTGPDSAERPPRTRRTPLRVRAPDTPGQPGGRPAPPRRRRK